MEQHHPYPSLALSPLSPFCQWDISAFHLQCGSFVIGVNGLGRMKHCVPLSEIAICFMRDQCGDPAGDDGLMSHNETITVSGGETSHCSVNSALILHFPEQNIYILGA